MSTRTRQTSGELVTGTITVASANFVRSYQPLSRIFVDEVGSPYEEHEANYVDLRRRGGLWHGWKSTAYHAEGAPCNLIRNLSNPSHITIVDRPSNQAAFLEGCARGNPGTPTVGLPMAIAELKELPKMVFSDFRRKRGPASSAVEYNFGWAPLIGDIRKLFTFPQRVESRLKTLNALIEQGSRGISRTIPVWEGSAALTWDDYPIDTTYNFTHNGELKKVTKADIYVTSHWRGEAFLPNLSSDGRAALARNLVLGMHPNQLLAQGYQLLPWSWAFDWFSDLGSYLETHNSGIAQVASLGSVSSKTRTVYEFPGGYANGFPSSKKLTLSKGRIVFETWARTLHTPYLPSFELPILSSSQVVTLSSILTNRRR